MCQRASVGPWHRDQEIPWPDRAGPVYRHRTVRAGVIEREPVTADGGRALAHQLVTRLGLDHGINRPLHLLKVHLPHHESDHVLTHAHNLFAGGQDLEDIQNLQHSPATKNLLGACRIPDSTRAGDFLRRFEDEDLDAVQRAIDEARVKVWQKLPKQDRQSIALDMDSTLKEVHGVCNQGADFSYQGTWASHPLLFTLAETGEPSRLVNRPGNRPSAEGAAALLGPCLETLAANFGEVFLRGDSTFSRKEILRQAVAHGALFALVHEVTAPVWLAAYDLSETAWKPLRAKPGSRFPPASGRTRRNRGPRLFWD